MPLPFKINNYNHDLLIIGSGGAGLTSAIFGLQKGLDVAIASKQEPLKSHTVAAAGGINASLGNISNDSYLWHIYDTIKASDWLADEDSVEFMCKNAKNAILMLDKLGVEFNKTKDGKIDQKVYGGQSTDFGNGPLAYRACYSHDKTGVTIMDKLYKEAKKNGANFYNYNFAIDLIQNDDKSNVMGAVFLDMSKGEINIIKAQNTIIASGGYSQIFATSTSSSACTGDGCGLEARAGGVLQDMEFIQFHPTAISKIGVLITEAARSTGAKLLNGLGERFMLKYAPKFMELAARDVVARAISQEIIEGRGCGVDKDHVLLDLTHLEHDYIKNNLPAVYENCVVFLKIDPSKQPIPISPASHYTMGGIATNANCQAIRYLNDAEVPINGLFAIGEAACVSVHGAGRLGCNSLLDLIVFGKKVIDELKSANENTKDNSMFIIQEFAKNLDKLFSVNHKAKSVENLMKELGSTMDLGCGVFRNANSLNNALEGLLKINSDFEKITIKDHSLKWNMELQQYLELKNMIKSSCCATLSALWRKESRGAHMRSDFTEKSDDFAFHSTSFLVNDQITIKKRAVRRIKNSTGAPKDIFKEAKRIY